MLLFAVSSLCMFTSSVFICASSEKFVVYERCNQESRPIDSHLSSQPEVWGLETRYQRLRVIHVIEMDIPSYDEGNISARRGTLGSTMYCQ